MATVEDGEILELDQPIHHSPSPLPQNPYRGGDPFLGAQQPRDQLPATFPRFHTSAYSHSRTRSASLSDINSQLHPPTPPEEPTLERDPYATSDTPPPPPPNQDSLPDSSNIPTHPHSFSLSTPSDPRSTSLPNLPSSHDLSWSRSAPSDPSPTPTAFCPSARAQTLNQPDYSVDPDRYSPTTDQPLFSDTPVYHAEPAPHFYYASHHPSVTPITSGSHPTSYVYAPTIRNEHPFPTNPTLNQPNPFSAIGVSYQTIHHLDSPRPALLKTNLQEEDQVPRRARARTLRLDPSSRDPSPYDHQYMPRSRKTRPSETFATKDVTRDEGDDERGRLDVEPRMSSFSDEEDQHEQPADALDSRNRHPDHSVPASKREDEGSLSQPKASETKNETVSQDEASDGEIDCHIPSPVISVATVPDESPSPPSSTKKKPPNFNAKKHLSELRRKALMSVKKRPAARSKSRSVEPTSRGANQSTAAATSSNDLEAPQNVQSALVGSRISKDGGRQLSASPARSQNSSDELAPGCGIQLDSTVQMVVSGVRRTMTRKQFAEWQSWPYQNRVLVDYSSDSSNGASSDERDDDDCDDDADGNLTGEVRRFAHRNRKTEIEAMKIRMIRLGKCPSMLFGGNKSGNGTKNSSSSSSLSVEKQKDRPVPEKDGNTTPKTSAPSQTQEKPPGLANEGDQGQQNADSKLMSSPKKTNVLELNVSNSSAVPGHSNSSLENLNDNINLSVSREKRSMLRSPESGSVLEIEKTAKPSKTGGVSKNNTVQEGNVSAPLQNGEAANHGKESHVPVRSPRSGVAASASSPIAELKRRIAAIEKTRDSLNQQRHKKQKTMTNEEIQATDRIRTDAEQNHLQRRVTGGTDMPRKSGMSTPHKVVEHGRGGQRYYSSGPSDKIQRKQMSLRVRDKRNGVMNIDTELQESTLDAMETSKPSNREKQDMETTLRLPDDNAERRYIDDLKLELKQKTKELMNKRDRTEQLRIAEIAIAEAQAKLSFTRSRVSALRDELQKAEQDVVDAEKECQQRAKVVSQLRLANGYSSTDIVSGQEEPTSKVQLTEGGDRSTLSTTMDITTESDCEEDMEQEDGKAADFVLRPSPYSPSVGDNFTSCLRALRAYLLRIPHHSKATDRIAGGILSSTWGVDLDPMKAICPQELRGQCSNKACEFQHLKVFKAPKDRALQVIHVIETFFSSGDKQKEEKSIVNARIAIHEGKDAAKTLSSLISTLCASSKALPYSCAAV